jgi:hypothetical protein
LYWTRDTLFQTSVPVVMTRLRFEKMVQYFHLNDSSTNAARGTLQHDKIHHVRPFLDKLITNCKAQYNLPREVSVDEAMVAFKGRQV